MGSVSKLQKLSNEDRISNLPDSILSHILSFLPTKSAMRTTTLSKRWKTPFLSLPGLDFDDSISIYVDSFSREYREKVSFMNFVDRILMLRGADLNLERFSLNCVGNYDEARVSEWIRDVIRHNVEEINLTLNFKSLYRLVPETYMCASVEILRLNRQIEIHVPENVSLPRLKVLELTDVKFSSCESVKKLLINCPVLEDLLMSSCKWISGYCVSIRGSSLKNLSFSCYLPVYGDERLKILIDTPTIETFRIEEFTSESIFLEENLQSIKTAYINIAHKLDAGVPRDVFGDSMFGLLEKISLVEFLTLSDNSLRALSHASKFGFPIFYNLTKLELLVDSSSGWILLPDILASSPNLQSLVFPHGLVDMFSFRSRFFRFSWSPPEVVPQCISSHLETIKISHFRGIDEELSMIKYFLKHGKALRTISIDCSLVRKDAMISKKLLRFRRASKTCSLDFINNKMC